ncbi:hypothetical protein, partial [Microbispora hainanensis]|uniref:hypothetical protein n=1 Tax=Microbispora hainanensis TaxID=568844 RepID=UPI0033EF833F
DQISPRQLTDKTHLSSVASLPGFPLAVKNITIRPAESSTKPISEPKIPPGFHTAAIDVLIGQGEHIKARIIIPERMDLAVGQPYSLLEPASVDAKTQGSGSLSWTIFSAGIIRDESLAASALGQLQAAAQIAPLGVQSAEVVGRGKQDGPQSDALLPPKPPLAAGDASASESADPVRHRLANLVQQLRAASSTADRRSRILALLEVNAEFLASEAIARQGLRKLLTKIQAFRRSCIVGADADRKSDWALVDKCALLNTKINQAKSLGNVLEARSRTEELRRVLASASTKELDLTYESKLLAAHYRWLSRLTDPA